MRRWRERLERLVPQRTGDIARFAGRLRPLVRRTIGEGRRRRRFWERFFAGSAVAALERGDRGAALAAVRRLLAPGNSRDSGGVGWLIGAGPGDPGLLTVRATELLQRADLVLYDNLVSDAILEYVRRDADRICVGKTPGGPRTSQATINEMLVREIGAGRRVVRLKGGDPFVFGRGGEELDALRRAGLPYEIVPGITAALGAAAYAGLSLTHRDLADSVRFVTVQHRRGAADSVDWRSLVADRQTLAIYMGVARLDEIRDGLIGAGMRPDTPFAIVERATTREQRIVTGELTTLPLVARRERVRSPALLIIGQVAAAARKASWFQPSPAVAEGSDLRFAIGRATAHS